MVRPIRIEMYGEYVLARMDIAKENLLGFVFSEEDEADVELTKLTPEHPLLTQFTQDEIDSFEFIYKKDMKAVHGIEKSPSN